MTEQPNIKAEILQYVLEQQDESGAVSLYDFADETGYSRGRVGRKSNECKVLECGVSPMCPWIIPGKEEQAREKLREWGYDV